MRSRRATCSSTRGRSTAGKKLERDGGERGIRTLDTGLSPYNALAGRPLRPLGHLSGEAELYLLDRDSRGALGVPDFRDRHRGGPATAAGRALILRHLVGHATGIFTFLGRATAAAG